MGQTEATRNRLDALGLVAAAASSLFIAVGGYVISQHGTRLDRKDDRITTLEINAARSMEHVTEHDKNSEHWIRKIIDTESRVITLERRVDRLETKPAARPKAFTSDDGKRLEMMIRALQRGTGGSNAGNNGGNAN